MLQQLIINDLAIINRVDLQFSNGLTVLTGETGAGKSIVITALGLALGDRADAAIIAPNKTQTRISVIFDLAKLPQAKTWLQQHELTTDNTECIIRRIVNKDGKSRAYINDIPVNITTLKDFASQLINIHGQHQHQTLLNSNNQLQLLDHYANNNSLLDVVKDKYNIYKKLIKQQDELLALNNKQDKLALIKYQIEELEQLQIANINLDKLNTEHKQLTNAEEIINNCDLVSSMVRQADISKALNIINELADFGINIDNISDILQGAVISLDEAEYELNELADKTSIDVERLHEVEQLLTNIHNIARKHKVNPENLTNHFNFLQSEAEKLSSIEQKINLIKKKIDSASTNYLKVAEKLSSTRIQAAKKLTKDIIEKMYLLAMPNAKFNIAISKANNEFHIHGYDKVEFLVATNPGQELQPLKKTASGGELSRISLAIEVILADKITMPTMVFDEVDVGISGNIATIVGQLLKTIGKKSQVLCITHLPQVAAFGQQHFNISKQQTKNITTVSVQQLDKQQSIQELARLLGSDKITKEALAHASNMLAEAACE
ncbi:MAG: DNA repair protein RecN [Legionellales bacterium]|nr:MAG: DNA repair protein RecN [Legionellales bacterium]